MSPGPTVPDVPGRGGSIGAGWRVDDAAELMRRWERAVAGEPATVVVSGDAGAGKTVLVRRLVDRAEQEGAVVVAGAAVDVDEALPCWPVASGLRRVLGAPPAAGVRARAARAALEPWREELAPLLGPGSGAGTGVLLDLVRRVLVGVAERRPVLLVIDDLHWADRATRELVISLVAHLVREPVLVVVTVRAEAVDDEHPLRRLLPELLRDRAVHGIDLAPLPRDAVTTIVEAAVPRPDAVPDLTELVWQRSRGNAFIVAETLAAVAAGSSDGLSPGLRGLVLGRVSGLGAVTRTVVHTLALGEEPVGHGLLAEVVGLSERALVPALREAADAGVVVVEQAVGSTAGGDDGYRLRHGLLRDVLAGELMPGERRAVHRRYAEVLDDRSGEADPALVLRRAHHWVRADDPLRALPAVVDAARTAEERHEFGMAHRQWMAALELRAAPRPVTAGARGAAALPSGSRPGAAASAHDDLLDRAADTARLAGEYDTAVTLLRRMVPDPAAAGPDDLPAVVRLGRSLLEAGRTGDAVDVLATAALAAEQAARASGSVAPVLAAQADALLVTGDVAGAHRAAERALAISRAQGEHAEQAPILATLGFALAYRENPDAGLAAVAEGLMIAERAGEPAAIGRAYLSWATLLSGPLHEIHEGIAVARQGVARMQDLGLGRSTGVQLLATAANGLFRLGHWGEASEAVDEAWALRPTGADALEVRLARCRLRVGRGDLDGAEEDLRAVDLLALDGASPASRYRVPLLTLRSGIAMWRGRPEEARALVATGLDVAEGTTDDAFAVAPLVWHGLRAEAEAVDRGRPADAAALTRLRRHVVELEQRVPSTVPALRRTVLAYVRMCRAEDRRAAGRSDGAAWDRVARTWTDLSNPYAAAYAQVRRAAALSAAGGSRSEVAGSLRSAAATAAAMGAAPFLAEIAGVARRARVPLEPMAPPTGNGGAPGRGRGATPAARRAPELSALTDREFEVLTVLADGLSNREIAGRLGIAERTVAQHVSTILRKTGCRSRTQAAALLQRLRARPSDDRPGERRA